MDTGTCGTCKGKRRKRGTAGRNAGHLADLENDGGLRFYDRCFHGIKNHVVQPSRKKMGR